MYVPHSPPFWFPDAKFPDAKSISSAQQVQQNTVCETAFLAQQFADNSMSFRNIVSDGTLGLCAQAAALVV